MKWKKINSHFRSHDFPISRILARESRGQVLKYQFFWFVLLVTCVPLATLSRQPTGDYPYKPIRLIVPYPPAGTTDFVAREVANNLGKRREALKSKA